MRYQKRSESGFRPHQGIIEFNTRGGGYMKELSKLRQVSVPIRGLLNLTCTESEIYHEEIYCNVSVPIRGLLNLTFSFIIIGYRVYSTHEFPSPSGDY